MNTQLDIKKRQKTEKGYFFTKGEVMTDFKAAIFDMDGTLLDSMWVWLEVDRKFLEGRGLPMDEAVSYTHLPHGR